jgi:hypothetical protein
MPTMNFTQSEGKVMRIWHPARIFLVCMLVLGGMISAAESRRLIRQPCNCPFRRHGSSPKSHDWTVTLNEHVAHVSFVAFVILTSSHSQ